MAENLKPCPFCGGEAEYKALECNCRGVELDEGTYHFIGCKNHCINSLWVRGTSKEEAFAKWNTRPSNWHTGTPSEEGDYLTKISYGNNSVLYEVRGCYCYPDIGLSFNPFIEGKVIAWQKIEEGEVNG